MNVDLCELDNPLLGQFFGDTIASTQPRKRAGKAAGKATIRKAPAKRTSAAAGRTPIMTLEEIEAAKARAREQPGT